MITSVHDLLAFLDAKIYASLDRKPYRLEPETIDHSVANQVIEAARAGFITAQPSMHSGKPVFDISFTPEGLVELLFIPRPELSKAIRISELNRKQSRHRGIQR
jgi:hypothetical protein